MNINKVLLNKYKQDSRFSRLNQLAQPVKELYFLGDNLLELLNKPKVAIIGSRKVSHYGRQVTEQITKDLVNAGVVVISGLALGVDSIAHRCAIENNGKTIAVLPSSLDKIYPASHTNLARNILKQGGSLLSEYPTGSSSPQKYQFIARNRIIASLADAVVITEAAKKSGSLHTANFAIELGSDVFAVPGNINSVNSAGTNKLIQDGAIPLLSSKDLLDYLGLDNTSDQTGLTNLNREEEKVYKLISSGVEEYDLLISKSGYSVAKLNEVLSSLELKDTIYSSNIGKWQAVSPA